MKTALQLSVLAAIFVVVATDLEALFWFAYSGWVGPALFWPLAVASWLALAFSAHGRPAPNSSSEVRRASALLAAAGVGCAGALAIVGPADPSFADTMHASGPTAFLFVVAWGLVRDPTEWTRRLAGVGCALTAMGTATAFGFDCGYRRSAFDLGPDLAPYLVGPFLVATVVYRLLEQTNAIEEL